MQDTGPISDRGHCHVHLHSLGVARVPRWTTCTLESSFLFRRDAIAYKRLSYGNVAGWLSVTAGMVSKRLNLSSNFFDHLVAPSFKHLGPLTPIPNSKGNPFMGTFNTRGWGKLAIFVRFSTVIAVYLGNGAR